MEKITSLQNKRIKNIKLLSEKSAARKDQQLFVVEGLKECLMAWVDSMALVDPLIEGKKDASAVAETDGTSLIKRCKTREQASKQIGGPSDTVFGVCH